MLQSINFTFLNIIQYKQGARRNIIFFIKNCLQIKVIQ